MKDCINCGQRMVFNIKLQRYECMFCGLKINIKNEDTFIEKLNLEDDYLNR